MTKTLSVWVNAARPKTLPLAVAGPLTAIALAIHEHISFNPVDAILCALIAILLQVLSNFANDLGDFQKGTDQAANRTDRSLASGLISEPHMKRAVAITALLSLIIGIALLYTINLSTNERWILFGIGCAAIIAAIAYTVGKKAYGYYGFGDIFVFVFFGLTSVLATYFILSQALTWQSWAAALAIGTFSVMVLNLNNIRDLEKDAKHNKRTIPVSIGFQRARIYHITLAAIGSVCWVILLLRFNAPYLGIPLFLLVIILQSFLNLNQEEFKEYNLQLKHTSLLTLLFAFVFFLNAIFNYLFP